MTSTMQIPSSPLPDKKKNVKHNLEEQPWYHGFRPRKDCQNLLKEPGDWLIRTTDNNQKFHTEIIMSLIDEKKRFQNLTLTNDHDKWSFTVLNKAKNKKPPPKFDSVYELVEHYKVKPLTNMPLRRPITRPKWLIKHEQVTFDKKKDLIGAGNFCNVYKGKYKKDEQETLEVAMKICHGAEDSKSLEEASQQRKSMLHEAELMSYYSNSHIIQLYGVACDHAPVIIVMEYCPGGNLQDHLLKCKDKIEVAERILYAAEAACGMRYLHYKKCVHRDLAARNCLISDRGMIKISDFGLSKLAEELGDKKKVEAEGDIETMAQVPLRWMAPEGLKRPQEFSTKSDVWSFGVLVYEIFNEGVKPWPNDEAKKIATNIRRNKMPEMPKITPEEIKTLVSKMWSADSEQRPKMKDIASKLHEIQKVNPIKNPVIKRQPTALGTQSSLEASETIDDDGKVDQKSEAVKKKGGSAEKTKTKTSASIEG